MKSLQLDKAIAFLGLLLAFSSPTIKAGEQSGGGSLGNKVEFANNVKPRTRLANIVITVKDCEFHFLEESIFDGESRYSESLKTHVYGLESYETNNGKLRLEVETEDGQIFTIEANP